MEVLSFRRLCFARVCIAETMESGRGELLLLLTSLSEPTGSALHRNLFKLHGSPPFPDSTCPLMCYRVLNDPISVQSALEVERQDYRDR